MLRKGIVTVGIALVATLLLASWLWLTTASADQHSSLAGDPRDYRSWWQAVRDSVFTAGVAGAFGGALTFGTKALFPGSRFRDLRQVAKNKDSLKQLQKESLDVLREEENRLILALEKVGFSHYADEIASFDDVLKKGARGAARTPRSAF